MATPEMQEKFEAAWAELAPEGKATPAVLMAIREKVGAPEPPAEVKEKLMALFEANGGSITKEQLIEFRKNLQA